MHSSFYFSNLFDLQISLSLLYCFPGWFAYCDRLPISLQCEFLNRLVDITILVFSRCSSILLLFGYFICCPFKGCVVLPLSCWLSFIVEKWIRALDIAAIKCSLFLNYIIRSAWLLFQMHSFSLYWSRLPNVACLTATQSTWPIKMLNLISLNTGWWCIYFSNFISYGDCLLSFSY